MSSSSSLTLVIDGEATRSAHAEGRHAWWLYAREILGHVALPYAELTPSDLTTPPDTPVLLLATGSGLTPDAVTRLTDWVSEGGSLVVAEPSPALADLAGVTSAPRADHGYVAFADSPIWTRTFERPLHAVGGTGLTVTGEAEALAHWTDDQSVAIAQRRIGKGSVIIFGADVWQSVVRIQQGFEVREDGTPAADGTAPIDDDILKCEDGLTLDFEHDRALPPGEPPVPTDFTHTYPPPAAVPVFDRPQADQWRSVLLQTVFWAAEHASAAAVWLHYWPAGVPAIAHMSHDADQNNDDDAQAALDAFAEADVKVTWCQVFPGGYSPEMFAAITAAGHENALHYNAMGDADLATWGWSQIRAQYAWAQAVTGVEDIISNKNHYTRWEGWTEFYTWCEQLGIEIDESRGPSKQGSVGFPFGTAHLSFPMGDVDHENRPMNVVNLPLHTQDLAWAGHIAVRDVVLDAAVAEHGVAHFLFHGPHLRHRPPTRAACPEVARLARERQMPWWTAAEINRWERSRRGVQLGIERTDGGWLVTARSELPIEGAGILLTADGLDAESLPSVDGATVSAVERHGRRFLELAVDIKPGDNSWLLCG